MRGAEQERPKTISVNSVGFSTFSSSVHAKFADCAQGSVFSLSRPA